ncbi:MAG: molybdenum transporter substrate-binding protein [Firmicutes bacterium]|nr:molybdenum transporter substrate-binding protein [Bacillota bacterium]
MYNNIIKVLLSMMLLVTLAFTAYAETPTKSDGGTIEIKVMSSGGFFSALQELAPSYEQKTGKKVILIPGASMGSSPTSIPARLARGEEADLVIMAGSELNKMVSDGFVVPGSQQDLVLSKIGMVVRAGEPKPDISTTDAVVRTLLDAKSIGYSASASGNYLANELFPRLGVWEQIKAKSEMVTKGRVAEWVARGDLEIGFQQVSELLSVPGSDFVGTLPEDIQKITVFSAGIAITSKTPGEGEKFIQFLTSSEACPIIIKQGLEPAGELK